MALTRMTRRRFTIGLWLLLVAPFAQAGEAQSQSFSANEIAPYCQLYLAGPGAGQIAQDLKVDSGQVEA